MTAMMISLTGLFARASEVMSNELNIFTSHVVHKNIKYLLKKKNGKKKLKKKIKI